METAPEIISAMCQAAAPGRDRLDNATQQRLRDLTQALIAARPGAGEEYERFLSIGTRGMILDSHELGRWLTDSTILVTGGTGCIGSVLMAQLSQRSPARLVSVSRGLTSGWPLAAGAEYVQADIRDMAALAAVVGEVRPDVIFHVAAQRSPALAEVEVHRSVTTNVLGTRNVIAAATQFSVPQVVCASTGKALRPYTPDMYAASKRAAEWILACAAARDTGTRYSAARFTHVMDNSIVYQQLQEWCVDGVIRLHGADIVFYVQSALESAQLLLRAGLGAVPGRLGVFAITDLGWPVSLLDMTLGMLKQTGSSTPVYFSGHDRGYETAAFPGLYDPRTAADVSPLLSAFEAHQAAKTPCATVDFFPLEFAADREYDKRLLALEETCDVNQEPDAVRDALDALSWSLLDATLRRVPGEVLARAVTVTAPHLGKLTGEHQRMLAGIQRQLGRA